MRYERQGLVLGNNSQKFLEKSCVSIIGIGALGSVVAELLVRGGIGKVKLFDRDVVEVSNLQRQVLFDEKDINVPKVIAAKKKLKKINKDVKLEAYFLHINNENISLIKSHLIIDCTDNMEIRRLIDEYGFKNKIHIVYGSAIRDKGYVYNLSKNRKYLNPLLYEKETFETCETSGVLGTLTNFIGSLQANEAIKVLSKNKFEDNLLFFDLKNNELVKIKVKKVKKIKKYDNLNEKKIFSYCGTYVINNNFDFNKLKSRFKKLGIKDFKTGFKYKEITVFKNSILINAKSEKGAKNIYIKYIGG